MTEQEISSLLQENRTLRQENERLKERVAVDDLTGLFKYHSEITQEVLQSRLQDAGRGKDPVCFLSLDLDFFKKVNDTYGTPIGDKVLQAFSVALKNSLRRTDVAFRIGGEEFGALLIGAEKEYSENIIQKILKNYEDVLKTLEGESVEGMPPFSGDLSKGLSFSGCLLKVRVVREYEERGFEYESMEGLYKRSAILERKAKVEGRNCVTIEGGETVVVRKDGAWQPEFSQEDAERYNLD